MESIVYLTCLTIFSTGPHHTVDAWRNRGVGGGWCNAVDGFGGGAVFVFKVFVGFRFSLVEFEVDGALNFG